MRCDDKDLSYDAALDAAARLSDELVLVAEERGPVLAAIADAKEASA